MAKRSLFQPANRPSRAARSFGLLGRRVAARPARVRQRNLRLEQLEARLALDGSGLPPVYPAGGAEGEGDPLVNFALIDGNSASATYNQAVSPRDYLGQISVWMFGYST